MGSSRATSGRGGRGRGRRASKSRSERAGLVFPVCRIDRYLKKGNYSNRVGAGAPVYLAAVLEYLACEVLELAGTQAKSANKNRITPTQIQLAVQNDEELSDLFGKATIPGAGMLPKAGLSPLQKSGEGKKQGASKSS